MAFKHSGVPIVPFCAPVEPAALLRFQGLTAGRCRSRPEPDASTRGRKRSQALQMLASVSAGDRRASERRPAGPPRQREFNRRKGGGKPNQSHGDVEEQQSS